MPRVQQSGSRRNWAAAGVLLAIGLVTAAADDKQLVLIPFEFDTSSWPDEDREYAEKMGEMFWKKIEREGKFILPESMLDVREVCQKLDFHPSTDTPLSKMAEVVKEHFQAHLAVWGKLHRLGEDRYEIWIRIGDFTGPEPTLLVDEHGIAENVHQIPHLYVKNALMKLYQKRAPAPSGPDPEEEQRWKEGPNLVANGDFEQAGPKGLPRWWDDHPMPPDKPGCEVRRVRTPEGEGYCVQFRMSQEIGDTYGVAYYSAYFPIQEGAKYRFQYRWRTDGPTPKVFLKGYDEMVEYGPDGKPLRKQWRECYRSQQQPKGPKNQWNVHTEDFTPRHTKYVPRKMRVMLYGYIGAGTMHFDDVVVKLLKPAPPDVAQKKVRRHSLETEVKLEEYEDEDVKYRAHRPGTRQDLPDASTGQDAPGK